MYFVKSNTQSIFRQQDIFYTSKRTLDRNNAVPNIILFNMVTVGYIW